MMSAFARIETVIENQSKVLQEMFHLIKKQNNQKKEEQVGHEDLARLNALFPVETMEDFNQLKAQLEADADFEKLVVS